MLTNASVQFYFEVARVAFGNKWVRERRNMELLWMQWEELSANEKEPLRLRGERCRTGWLGRERVG
jgi:hypothetical protein